MARLLNHVGLSSLNQLLKQGLKVAARDKLTIRVDGLVIQGPTASWSVLSEIAAGEFEPLEIDLFKGTIAPNMVVVDIGANIGYYTLLAARLVGAHGRVFAFEPDPRTYGALTANVRANNLANVTAIAQALSDTEGEQEIFLRSKAEQSSLYASSSRKRPERTYRVKTTTVDAILGGVAADVVKMDIEGAEPAALGGMHNSLKPETVVFMEFNPSALDAAGADPEEFSRLLRERFARIDVICSDRVIPFERPLDGLTNLRCSGWRG